MPRRTATLATLATSTLLIVPALAWAKAPSLKALNVDRTAKGVWVVTADADFTRSAKTAKGTADARSRGILTVTLISGRHRVTATDTALFGESAKHGHPVHFHIRIPRAVAAVLGSPKRIRVRSTLARETATTKKGAMAVGNGASAGLGSDTFIRIGHGTCLYPMSDTQGPCPPAPPAPTVAFEQAVGGNTALICVNFWGSGYAGPNFSNIFLSATTFATVGYGWLFGSGQSPAVDPSGIFSYPSYLDQWVGGYAQLTSGPNLSGAIPTSVLRAPVGPSTGPATLSLASQVQGLPTSWSLSPLSQSEASGVC